MELIIFNFVVSLLVLVVVVRVNSRCDQLDRLEWKIDVLMGRQGSEDAWQSAMSARVHDEIAAGRKIAAIRAYRMAHPEAGLKQAKDAVEAIASGATEEA